MYTPEPKRMEQLHHLVENAMVCNSTVYYYSYRRFIIFPPRCSYSIVMICHILCYFFHDTDLPLVGYYVVSCAFSLSILLRTFIR
jgi:hypothetical protein